MSRRLAMLAAVVVLCPASTCLAQTRAPSPKAAAAKPPQAKAPLTVTEADRLAFRKKGETSGGGDTLPIFLKYYPEDYLPFERDMILAIKRGAPEAELSTRAFTFSRAMRERVAPYFKQAPTDDLVAFARDRLGVMEQLSTVSPRACYEYVELSGVSQEAIDTLPRAFGRDLRINNTMQFELAAKGQANPVVREKPSRTDFDQAVLAFVTAGGDKSWLQAMATGQPRQQPPEVRCTSAKAWVQGLLTLPPELAARFLAQ